MQTVENPSKQPSRSYPEPMPVIDEQALKGAGFHIMRCMYLELYKPFMFTSDRLNKHWGYTVADLIVLNYVAVIEGGFQLTALGRLVFHVYYDEFQAKLRREAEREKRIQDRFARDEYDEWNGGAFDLLDF